MILRVCANKKGFNSVRFSKGFNVIVADRTKESTKKDSRNGLGKSTLLNIIHFCLGGDESPNKGLRVQELQGWEFYLDLLIRGKRITVSRSVDNTSSIMTNADEEWFSRDYERDSGHSPRQVMMDFGGSESTMHRRKKDEWKSVLGWGLYNLQAESEAMQSVSFRSLISYDIRRNQFEIPFENHPRQSTKDKHISNAYMLDLNWEYAKQWQDLKNRKKNVDSIQRAIKDGDGLLANMLGTVGELETERDRLQRLINKSDRELSQFQVHPQYVQIENEANDLTRQIHNLNNNVLQLKRLIDFHDISVNEEQPARDSKVIELYEKAGATLGATVVKRIEEVQAFHIQITRNRQDYLRNEKMRLNQELGNARIEIEQLSNRRAELMQVLETHGALEEYSRLQQLNLGQRSSLEAIEKQIEKLNQIETETSQITIEREQLHLDARIDLDERSTLKQARTIFSSNSEALYEAPGSLVVDLDRETGYKFRVDIKRSESAGISKMKVFCYDLMRAELWSTRDVRLGFLIHDSTIFADVDERQIARALELGERKSRECGFQYIVCLNSDKIPREEFSEGFDIDKFVCLTLTDDKPEGSLLGMRY